MISQNQNMGIERACYCCFPVQKALSNFPVVSVQLELIGPDPTAASLDPGLRRPIPLHTHEDVDEGPCLPILPGTEYGICVSMTMPGPWCTPHKHQVRDLIQVPLLFWFL